MPTSQILNVPIPDPSVITTERIDRLRIELKQEIKEVAHSLRDTIGTRLDGMDKAASILEGNVTRVPTVLDRELIRINELFLEKFAGIETQFRERDVRTDQDKLAATTAVNAALQAQKEAAAAQNIANAAAINKSETGFTKEIDGLKVLITATRDAIGSQIDDITARLNRSESVAVGIRETKTDSRLGVGSAVGIMGGIISALGLVAMIIFGVVTSMNRSAALVPYEARKTDDVMAKRVDDVINRLDALAARTGAR